MIVTTRHVTSVIATIPIGTASSDSVVSSNTDATFSVAAIQTLTNSNTSHMTFSEVRK